MGWIPVQYANSFAECLDMQILETLWCPTEPAVAGKQLACLKTYIFSR